MNYWYGYFLTLLSTVGIIIIFTKLTKEQSVALIAVVLIYAIGIPLACYIAKL